MFREIFDHLQDVGGEHLSERHARGRISDAQKGIEFFNGGKSEIDGDLRRNDGRIKSVFHSVCSVDFMSDSEHVHGIGKETSD